MLWWSVNLNQSKRKWILLKVYKIIFVEGIHYSWWICTKDFSTPELYNDSSTLSLSIVFTYQLNRYRKMDKDNWKKQCFRCTTINSKKCPKCVRHSSKDIAHFNQFKSCRGWKQADSRWATLAWRLFWAEGKWNPADTRDTFAPSLTT